ncbi:hypothetical protein RRG08_036220 [Elysia crispata]|uniref:Uncharacterized protein n=1 Tax=Elysia crispata TaxID=231223 RepID=A0AAE0XEI3_9GAST|nr:hypothetical protein RRG08_036220 [Elysia crispata]
MSRSLTRAVSRDQLHVTESIRISDLQLRSHSRDRSIWFRDLTHINQTFCLIQRELHHRPCMYQVLYLSVLPCQNWVVTKETFVMLSKRQCCSRSSWRWQFGWVLRELSPGVGSINDHPIALAVRSHRYSPVLASSRFLRVFFPHNLTKTQYRKPLS